MEYKYENLDVWKLSKELIKKVYLLAAKFPKSEEFNLTSQIKRAVVSVCLNIAEGSVRQSNKEFKQFIRIAIGSLVEVDTCLKISIELRYIKLIEYDALSPLIGKLYFKLFGLEKSIKNDSNNSNASNDSNGGLL